MPEDRPSGYSRPLCCSFAATIASGAEYFRLTWVWPVSLSQRRPTYAATSLILVSPFAPWRRVQASLCCFQRRFWAGSSTVTTAILPRRVDLLVFVFSPTLLWPSPPLRARCSDGAICHGPLGDAHHHQSSSENC